MTLASEFSQFLKHEVDEGFDVLYSKETHSREDRYRVNIAPCVQILKHLCVLSFLGDKRKGTLHLEDITLALTLSVDS